MRSALRRPAVRIGMAAALLLVLAGVGISIRELARESGIMTPHGMLTSVNSGYVGFVAELRAAGAAVEVVTHRPDVPVIYGTLPATDANYLRVNGTTVGVFQFGGEQAAATYASHLSGGDYVDTGAGQGIIVDYAAPPHFYRERDLIVVYVGTDLRMLSLLASVLGPPFTEGHV